MHTFILKSGTDLPYYPKSTDEYNLNVEFFLNLERSISRNNIRGLVVGYPLVENKPVYSF
jgi:hypothetical protein